MNETQCEDVEKLNRQEKNEIFICKNQFSFVSKKINGATVMCRKQYIEMNINKLKKCMVYQ